MLAKDIARPHSPNGIVRNHAGEGYCTSTQSEWNCEESCWRRILHVHTVRSRHRLVGLVVKASASRAEDPGFESRLRQDFLGVESKIGTPVAKWLPCQAPGVIGSALGLVGPVSVY